MKILIQCGDHFENQHRVFLLAKELKRKGHEPIILMYKVGGGNIFKCNGISVRYMSDYLKKQNISNQSNLNFSSKIFNDLKISDFINVEIKRRPMISWPSQINKTSLETSKYVKAINNLLEDVNPNHVVIWNGFTGYVANVLRVLTNYKNISCSFIERGLLKDSIFIDSQGVNGNSTLSNILDFNHEDNDLKKYVAELFFKEPVNSNELEMQYPDYLKGKKIVFFPLQVQLDTNIILYCKYNTMREVFFEVYNKLNQENTIFVIRPHPEESPDTLSNFPILNNVIVSKDLDLNFWLEASDLVVTINSTVGLEALIKGKPVICLGKSIYSSLGCLSSYKNIKHDRGYILNEIVNYLGYLLNNNLIVKDSKYNENIIYKLFGGYDISIKSESKIIFTDSIARVFIDFSLSGTLNLTYRKISEPITLNWIEENVIKKFIGDKEYKFVSNINESNIVITDKPYESISFKNDLVYLDVYGVQLK